MRAKRTGKQGGVPPGLAALRAACRGLAFEPHDIAPFLDARGRYEVPLDREFPLLIKLFRYTSARHTRGATWHERLELFLPLDGPARFRMGEQEVALERGDLLVVDHLKLHHVVDFPGFDTRVIVVSFLPEFVYSLGSPTHDYAFLLPFYAAGTEGPQVLRAREPAAETVGTALARLVQCYFRERGGPYFQAGCKLHLLGALYPLARHGGATDVRQWQFLRQQERTLRLKPLFDHIREHFAERLTVPQAAARVHMSTAQFMKAFKQVAGLTLVAYINHVRLAQAVRLLRQTNHSIADIACEVGFADQSYFDRRFKAAFGLSPMAFRSGRPAKAATPVFSPAGPGS